MADTNISAKLEGGAVQNSGNPVFDATVNVVMNSNRFYQPKDYDTVFSALLAIYEKEPKRTNPTKVKSVAQMQREARELDVRPR